MRRREFVRHAAIAAPALVGVPRRSGGDWWGSAQERDADLVIIGGGLGGCAAALAALRGGLRVALTEETDWLGGQLTAQAVPPDENRWIETIGGTASYLALREAIRVAYRARPSLTERARAMPQLNPGGGWVSRLCCEPRVALAALEAMLAPYVERGQLRVLREYAAISAETDGDRVRAVRLRSSAGGADVVLRGAYFADATELGDLLPLTGTEFVMGAESQHETHEPHAAGEAQPDNQQGFTWCFAMDYLPGEDHRIARPAEYERWRAVSIDDASGTMRPLLSFEEPEVQRIGFDPDKRTGFWSYRRIINRDFFTAGTFASDITVVNWGQNDYSFGPLVGVSDAEAAAHRQHAKQLSLSLLYWLQTEAPRPDGGAGWAGLRLRPDVMGTADGLAKYAYIRESRRLRAVFTVREQDVSRDLRVQETGAAAGAVTATPFADSVGIGHYSMDLHRTTRGDRGRYGDTLPFQIPLGALIPRRMENLLAAGKNLGVTHLANGCYRLHPVEWNVGEAAGALAAFCVRRRARPHGVRASGARLADFQRELAASGVPLMWPSDLR